MSLLAGNLDPAVDSDRNLRILPPGAEGWSEKELGTFFTDGDGEE